MFMTKIYDFTVYNCVTYNLEWTRRIKVLLESFIFEIRLEKIVFEVFWNGL